MCQTFEVKFKRARLRSAQSECAMLSYGIYPYHNGRINTLDVAATGLEDIMSVMYGAWLASAARE
jgi:hypothetical protein